MIKFFSQKLNKKGFTLAELLIVVAIIAVLVAIAIPVFSGQLVKAKEAADEANIRAWYAEETIKLLDNDTGSFPTSYTGSVALNFSTKLTISATAGLKYDADKISDLELPYPTV